MNKIIKFFSIYPLSCICICTIWVLCFCTVPETPLSDVAFIDKWVHIVMYGGTCSVIWFENLRRRSCPPLRRVVIWAWLAPALMSGVIELLQAYCTGGRRSGDWLDFAANSTGATLALVIPVLFKLCKK